MLLFNVFLIGQVNGQHQIDLLSPKFNTFITEFKNDIWIASTNDGWNRFNGIGTTHFKLNDTLSGLNDEVLQSALFKDLEGGFWTSTYNSICYFDASVQKFKSFQLQIDNEIIDEGYHVFASIKSFIYLKAGDTILVYDTGQKRIVEIIGLSYGMRFGVKGDLIVACPWLLNDGVEIWKKSNDWVKKIVKFTDCEFYEKEIQVSQVLFYKTEIFLISNIGLINLDMTDPCLSTIYPSPNIEFNIAFLFKNNLLISTKGDGVFVFDLLKNEYSQLLTDESDGVQLLTNSPADIFVDKVNRLWLSYYDVGIQIVSNVDELISKKIKAANNWLKFDHYEDLVVYTDKKNKFVVDGLDSNMPKIEIVNSKNIDLKQILDIEIIDSLNALVFGNFQIRNYTFTNRDFKMVPFEFGQRIMDKKMFKDSLYVIANFHLFSSSLNELRFEKRESCKYEGEIFGFGPFTNTYKSYFLNTSEFWINGPSIDTLINVGSYLNQVTNDSLQNNFYCATNSGLYKIDSTYKVSKLATAPWEIDNKTISEIDYQDGYLYMSIENKLARYHIETAELKYFTKDRFEHTPVFAIQDSVIHVAEKYVTSYHIHEAFTDTNNYTLKFDELKINREVFDHRSVDLTNGLDLHYTQNEVALTYYTNNWHNADLSSVRYKLLPHYPEWTIVENGAEVEFPFLPPDDYQYVVQGILPSGEMTEMTKFDFEINPPWWRTYWFYSLAGLSLISLGFFLYRYRVGQLTQALRIKNELNQLEKSALQAQMNPHFIFNCLNSIQSFIMDNEKEQAMEYLGKFAKLIRLNLNASVDSQIRLDQEILILENYLALEQLRADHSFDYEITNSNDLYPEEIEIPPMLIQPFVENAVIHGMKGLTSDGMINIDFHEEDTTLLIDIKDNGSGNIKNKLSKKHRSLGMSITQKRLAHINKASSDVYSIEELPSDEGTYIRVRIAL